MQDHLKELDDGEEILSLKNHPESMGKFWAVYHWLLNLKNSPKIAKQNFNINILGQHTLGIHIVLP